jgi:hypothetical protein
MSRIALPFLAALLLAPAAVACAPARSAPAPVSGKLRAPVAVEAKVGDGTAQVTVRFQRAASGVRVRVEGLDGLAVTSAATPADGASFDRGAVVTFDVAFTPGPGRSFLRVAVQGDFGGGPRATAASFAVGERPRGSARKVTGTVVESPDGERVKVLPSGK